MIVEITIKDDAGNVLAEKVADACYPCQYKAHVEKPIGFSPIGDRGSYILTGWTYQPMIALRGRDNFPEPTKNPPPFAPLPNNPLLTTKG